MSVEKVTEKFERQMVTVAAEQNDLTEKSVMVIVPVFDEDLNVIKYDRPDLYKVQQADTDRLATHIMEHKHADLVTVGNSRTVIDLVNRVSEPYDCVIFLHDILALEKSSVLNTLREHKPDLFVIDLL